MTSSPNQFNARGLSNPAQPLLPSSESPIEGPRALSLHRTQSSTKTNVGLAVGAVLLTAGGATAACLGFGLIGFAFDTIGVYCALGLLLKD